MSLKIETFYETRKQLFDICGNLINKEKYQFINILSEYLKDIVSSIDSEIQKTTRNSMINWKEKKNPKLLSKIINNDDNINLINQSMNKITETNYMSIVNKITESLTEDNFRQMPEYSKYLFEIVIKKCLFDENLIKDYLYFIDGFKNDIEKNIYNYMEKYIHSTFLLFGTNLCLKDYIYIGYINNITNYYNIGKIFANLYLIQKDKDVKHYYFTENLFYTKLKSCLTIINDYLDWNPNDLDSLNSRIYLIFGIIETLQSDIFNIINNEDKNLLNGLLKQIYSADIISNKIKFKVLDIQDMISKYENLNVKKYVKPEVKPEMKPEVKPEVKSEVKSEVKPEVKSEIEIEVKHNNYINYATKLKINKNNIDDKNNNKDDKNNNKDDKNNNKDDNKDNKDYKNNNKDDNNIENENENKKYKNKKYYNKNKKDLNKNNKNKNNNINENSNNQNIDNDGFIKIERKNKINKL